MRPLLSVGVTAVLVLGTIQVATADHLYACSTWWAATGEYHAHDGGPNRDHCQGGDHVDSMRGFGDADQLYGAKQKDWIRGATGSDDLYDNAGDGDYDLMCDGSGSDVLDPRDGDTKDEQWLLKADGSTDWLRSADDELWYYSDSCPF